MSNTDKTRKYSISDIIDVLNICHEENFQSPKVNISNKDDDYDSGNAESICSPKSSKSFIFDESFESLEGKDYVSKDEAEEITDIQSVNVKDTVPKFEHSSLKLKSENNSLIPGISNMRCGLLNSDNDAVIIVLDKDKNIQYVNSSLEKLESYLQSDLLKNEQPNSKINKTQEKDVEKKTNRIEKNETEDSEKAPKSKRGRKRVYNEFNNEEEREESKRSRNNQACRKFRNSKTTKIKTLYNMESQLLQQNLNLKEQVSALTKQIELMRGKVGNEKKVNC